MKLLEASDLLFVIVFSATQGDVSIIGDFYSSVSPPTSSFLVKDEPSVFVSLLLVVYNWGYSAKFIWEGSSPMSKVFLFKYFFLKTYPGPSFSKGGYGYPPEK